MPADRLVSLDVFRGLAVAGMVLVNNPGTWRAVYAPLRHAEWDGWTPTDLVFPFFLFIVGAAVPLALGRRLAEGTPRGRLAGRVLRRAAAIFALGLVLNAVPSFDLASLRIPGVLQRIAACYLVTALLFLSTGWRAQAAVGAGALLGYWAALALVPVPGFGAGDLSPAGNLAAWIDRTVLGPHIWRPGRVYDPEGILSTVPAIATTLAGALAGRWIVHGRGGLGRTPDPAPVRVDWPLPAAAARAARDAIEGAARADRRIARWLVLAGLAGAALGLLWGQWWPINKSLWTGSYALFTAGAAALALGACYWLVDARGLRWWTPPCVALGTNALAVFFLSTLLAKLLLWVRVTGAGGRPRPLHAVLYEGWFAPWAPAEIASLAWAVANVLLWLALMWPLHRRGIRLTV
jgi:predicted acyltransferase